MNGHDEYLLLMSVALDNEATSAELNRLHAHLRSCVPCTQAWEVWLGLDQRLASAPAIAPPADLTERVMARVRRSGVVKRREGWFGWGAWTAALSLVTMLFFWGVLALLWIQGRAVGLAEAADTVLSWSATVWLLMRGVAVAVGAIGAPTLAAALVALSVITCALGVMWLWLLVRRGRFSRAVLTQ